VRRARRDEEATVQQEPEELEAAREQATAALAAWDLAPEEWRVVGVVPGGLGSELRPVVEIGGERFLLRREPPDLGEGDVRFRHELMRHLGDEGLPVPPLRPRPGGGTYATVAGDLYELQAWRAGERYRADAPEATHQAEAAAGALGALHQASAAFDGAPHLWPATREPRALAEAYVDLIRRAAGRGDVGAAVASAAGRVAEAAGERVTAAAAALAVTPGPPELHIHGDYQPRNLAFGRAGVVAIYDFDAVRWARRLDELAYALLGFTALRDDADSGPEPLVDDGLDVLRAHAFLQAYGRVAPPAEDEAALLGDALTLAFPVLVANGLAEDLIFADEYGGPPPDADILPRLEWADAFWLWLDRYRGVLAEAWAGAARATSG
jgi:Ser/Thr protein kinase RdoA (MazF antagonist)